MQSLASQVSIAGTLEISGYGSSWSQTSWHPTDSAWAGGPISFEPDVDIDMRCSHTLECHPQYSLGFDVPSLNFSDELKVVAGATFNGGGSPYGFPWQASITQVGAGRGDIIIDNGIMTLSDSSLDNIGGTEGNLRVSNNGLLTVSDSVLTIGNQISRDVRLFR